MKFYFVRTRSVIIKGISTKNIRFSSDGQGSLPDFNEKGDLIGLKLGECSLLYYEVKKAIQEEGISIEEAIKVITTSPAKLLKLHKKGEVKIGNDGDLVLVHKSDLSIDTVIAKGQVMIENKKVVVNNTF